MVDVVVGDRFVITGPHRMGPTWHPDQPHKPGSGQPRAWSSHARDRSSRPISRTEFAIDFGQEFQVLEVVRTRQFVQVRVEVSSLTQISRMSVWISTARNGDEWVTILPRRPTEVDESAEDVEAAGWEVVT